MALVGQLLRVPDVKLGTFTNYSIAVAGMLTHLVRLSPRKLPRPARLGQVAPLTTKGNFQ